jgi:hypothetical protein
MGNGRNRGSHETYFTAPKGNEIASGGGMVILALIGTTLSAIGASNPAKPKPVNESAWRHYTLFRWSVKLSVVAFTVHIAYGS